MDNKFSEKNSQDILNEVIIEDLKKTDAVSDSLESSMSSKDTELREVSENTESTENVRSKEFQEIFEILKAESVTETPKVSEDTEEFIIVSEDALSEDSVSEDANEVLSESSEEEISKEMEEYTEMVLVPEGPDDILHKMPLELREKHNYDPTPIDEIQEQRRMRRIIQKKKRLRPLGVLLVVCIILAIMASPLFAVKEYRSNVSENYTKQELLDTLGLREGMNIFRVKLMSLSNKLRSNPYIEASEINISLPDTVIITVDERKVRGSLFADDSYLYIDQNGRVLDINKTPASGHPIITGLKFSEYDLGRLMEIENPSSLSTAVSVSQLFEKYELSDYTIYLDVTDTNNISARINSAEILLGPNVRMDEKIRTLSAIMPYISADAMGTLDLSDMDAQIVFKYLT